MERREVGLDQPPHLQPHPAAAGPEGGELVTARSVTHNSLEQLPGLEVRHGLHVLVVDGDDPVSDQQQAVTGSSHRDLDDLQRRSSVNICPAPQPEESYTSVEDL